MMKFITKFWQEYGILKVIFLVLCVYVTLDELDVFFYEKPTLTSTSRVPLAPEDFPEITVCPEPTAHKHILQELGYTEMFNFKAGIELFPVATNQGFGWIGNSSESIENVMRRVSTVNSSEDCPISLTSYVRPRGAAGPPELFQFRLSRALLPFHQCCKIIYPDIAKREPIQGFSISLEADQQSKYKSLKVLMADRVSYSVLIQNEKTIYGDDIEIPEMTGYYSMYKMRVFQEMHYENEPKYPCKNYKEVGEYDKCLENDLSDELHRIVNFTPPWLTDNSDLWWRGNLSFNSEEIRGKYFQFFEKVNFVSYYTGKCLVPCKRNTFELKYIGMLESRNASGFAVWLDGYVARTTSEPQISTMTLITRIGGIIGVGKNLLWLVILLLSSFTLFTRKCILPRKKKKKIGISILI